MRSFPKISLAILFGSVARGTASAASDLDLGVWMAEEDPGAFWEIELAVGDVARRTIDLIDLRRAPPLLRFEIACHGVPVVEREPMSWSHFKAHAMIDWWDWAPTARMIQRVTKARLREEADVGET